MLRGVKNATLEGYSVCRWPGGQLRVSSTGLFALMAGH